MALKGRMHSGDAITKKAYKLGYKDGQADAQKLLACCVRANSELWESLLRLDDESPAGGTGVVLPLPFAESLVKLLLKPGPHKKHSQLLARHVKRANQSTRELIEKLEHLADEDKGHPAASRPLARTRTLTEPLS